MKIRIIAAIDQDTYGIGYQGKLLYTSKDDMKHFAGVTTGEGNFKNAVIMGRRTYESICGLTLSDNEPADYKVLKNRVNIVVSRSAASLKPPHKTPRSDLYFVESLDDAERLAKEKGINEVWVIGGGEIYREYVNGGRPYCDIVLTHFAPTTTTPATTTTPTTTTPATTTTTTLTTTPTPTTTTPTTTTPATTTTTTLTTTPTPTTTTTTTPTTATPKPADTFFPRIDMSRHYISNTQYLSDNTRVLTYQYVQNQQECQYLKLLQELLDNGHRRQSRNAITYSLFGKRLTFDLSKGFPLLTSKRVYFRGVAKELLWFIRGDTNAKHLSDDNVRIWDGNTSKEFLNGLNLKYKEGDGGPIYGFQWRHWNAEYKGCDEDYTGTGIDQLQECINLIKTNPYSRRIFLHAWNVGQLKEMALPPCHVSYQFYVEEGNKLSCQMYQRSGDVFLGVPFNIASTALLTHLIAHFCGYEVGHIYVCLGDVHIYDDHINQVKEQLSKPTYPFPKLVINGVTPDAIDGYQYDDLMIVDYKHSGTIKAQMVA